MLKVTYDREVDALYVTLCEAPWAHTRSLSESRNVDYSADGTPIGVELLHASKGIDLTDLPRASEIGDALRDSFRVFA
jgi:uncharacterized protein YuzE